MACCHGTATYFCCYPDPCGCDCGNCQDPGSCSNCTCHPSGCNQPPACPGSCGHTPSIMSVAGCCTCNSGQWGYAWPCCNCCHGSAQSGNLCPNCGDQLGFSTDCNLYRYADRVDTGPSSGYMVDFTKALFMTYAPLSQGTIGNMRAANDDSCC